MRYTFHGPIHHGHVHYGHHMAAMAMHTPYHLTLLEVYSTLSINLLYGSPRRQVRHNGKPPEGDEDAAEP